MTHLRFLSKDGIRVVRLGDRFTIGRHPDNDLVMDDQQVGRWHARIQWQDGQYVVYDLGSQNGTYVQRVAIVDPVAVKPNRPESLMPNDEIRIGSARLIFEVYASVDSGVEHVRDPAGDAPSGTADRSAVASADPTLPFPGTVPRSGLPPTPSFASPDQAPDAEASALHDAQARIETLERQIAELNRQLEQRKM